MSAGGIGTRRVALNTAASYVQIVVAMGVQLTLIPLIIGHVGKEDYGLWVLTFSVMSFLGLLDFGLAPGVVKYVAQAKGSGDVARRNRMLSTLGVIYGGLAVASLLGLLVLATVYGAAFDLPEATRPRAVALLLILGARTWAVGLPLSLFRGVLFGDQRIYLINLFQIIASLLLGVGVWTVLSLGHGLLAMAWVNVGAMAVEHVLYLVFAFKVMPDLRISWRLFDRSLLGEAVSFGAFQFIVMVSGLVLFRTDILIIQICLSLSAVALYSVPLKIAEYAMMMIKQFVKVLTPIAAQLKGSGDEAGLRVLLITGARFALAPAAMIATGAWTLGEEALILWVGPSFAESAPVLVTLTTALALSVPQLIISGVFTMTGRHRFTAAASLAAMSLNLVASLTLVWPLGITGVALGTLSAAAIVDATLVVGAAGRSLSLGFPRYAARIFLPALVPALLQAGITLGIKALLPPPNLFVLVLEAVPGALAFVGLFWFVFLDAEEKQMLRLRGGRG